MSANPLQMADLLPLPPASNPLIAGWPLLLGLIVLLLAVILWRHQRNPYRRLLKRLNRGEPARRVAHELARLPLPSQAVQQLDLLRFQAKDPQAIEVARLIQRGLHG